MDGRSLLISLGLALLAFVLNSLAVALTDHPGDEPSFWARLRRALGRASFLRHGAIDLLSAALHVPGRAQLPLLYPLDDDPTMVTKPPAPPPGAALLAILSLALLSACLFGCAVTPQVALTTSIKAQQVALTTYLHYDAVHQLDLVHGSKTRKEAQGKLTAYRAQRQTVVASIRAAATATATAADLLDTVPSPAPAAPVSALIQPIQPLPAVAGGR